MQAAQYIQSKLEQIRTLDALLVDKGSLEESIIHRILSKKFRKYAVDDAFSKHLRAVVKTRLKKMLRFHSLGYSADINCGDCQHLQKLIGQNCFH